MAERKLYTPLRHGDAVAGGFHVGDRVRLTVEAERMQGRYASLLGTVVGQSRDKSRVVVVRDGRSSRETWAPSLWRMAKLGEKNLSTPGLWPALSDSVSKDGGGE